MKFIVGYDAGVGGLVEVAEPEVPLWGTVSSTLAIFLPKA